MLYLHSDHPQLQMQKQLINDKDPDCMIIHNILILYTNDYNKMRKMLLLN